MICPCTRLTPHSPPLRSGPSPTRSTKPKSGGATLNLAPLTLRLAPRRSAPQEAAPVEDYYSSHRFPPHRSAPPEAVLEENLHSSGTASQTGNLASLGNPASTLPHTPGGSSPRFRTSAHSELGAFPHNPPR